jgi:hypothetical protein
MIRGLCPTYSALVAETLDLLPIAMPAEWNTLSNTTKTRQMFWIALEITR